MSYNLVFNDAPLRCCGLMTGEGFHDSVIDTSRKIPHPWRKNEFTHGARVTTVEDHTNALQKLINESKSCQRNCVMIVLSSAQTNEKTAAEKMGFKVIQEFWNPNSGNLVYIMTYLHYADHDSYDGDWD